MSQRLLEQFNNLKSVQPDANWQTTTRDFLVKRVKLDTVAHQTTWAEKFEMISIVFFGKYMPSTAKMTAVIVGLALIGGTNMMAQAEYVPGRPLYAVKRVYEKVEFVFAVSAESEAKIHLKHANERQKEATKIAADQSNLQDKASNLNTVIKSFEQNIEAAKSSLAIVKDQAANSDNGQKAVDLAKEITQNTNNAIKNLDDVKNTSSSTAIALTVAEAQSVAEDANTASLKILVEQATPADGQVSNDELKGLITQKLDRDSAKIKKIEAFAEQVQNTVDNQPIDAKTDQIATQDIKDAVQKSNDAQKIVKEAKSLLEENSLPEAMDKVEKVSDIAQASNKVITKVETQSNAAAKDKLENQSTTSPRVITNPQ